MADDDFELHRALEEMAPAAVRTLVELASTPNLSSGVRREAVSRLRQIQSAGLMDLVPADLRARADRILARDG